MSVGLWDDANLKWHMPIVGEICHSENICHFLGCYAALRIYFPENAFGDGHAFWIFVPGSTDKGKCQPPIWKSFSSSVADYSSTGLTRRPGSDIQSGLIVLISLMKYLGRPV